MNFELTVAHRRVEVVGRPELREPLHVRRRVRRDLGGDLRSARRHGGLARGPRRRRADQAVAECQGRERGEDGDRGPHCGLFVCVFLLCGATNETVLLVTCVRAILYLKVLLLTT